MMIALLFAVSLVKEAKGLQVMIKTNNWYCFGFPADFKTILDVDYLITGMNPEDVNFEAIQSGKQIKTMGDKRSAEIRVESTGLE